MLEPWIIEQIRRREEEERRRHEQPRLEIPIDERYKRDRPEDEEEDREDREDREKKDRDGGNRGVVIIEI